jgi:large-conductance mechanosensitive channel
MREWLTALARGRMLEVALALAFGTTLATFATTLVNIPVSALAQHVGRSPYEDIFFAPYTLNFSLGETVIVYGEALEALLSLGLLTVVAVIIVQRRDRVLGVCQFCASRIPHESKHCAYCGSGLVPDQR